MGSRYNPLAEGHVVEVGKLHRQSIWQLTKKGREQREMVEDELEQLGYCRTKIGTDWFWIQGELCKHEPDLSTLSLAHTSQPEDESTTIECEIEVHCSKCSRAGHSIIRIAKGSINW